MAVYKEGIMAKRVITALVLAAVLATLIIFCGSWYFTAVMCVASLFGVYEILKCIKAERAYFISVPAYILSVFLPISEKLDLMPENGYVYVFIFGAFYLLALLVFGGGSESYSFEKVSSAFLMTSYILLGMTTLTSLGCSVNHGVLLFVAVWVVCAFTDILALFSGMLFGKHKLAPKVSPKKTVEGAIGGIVFCTLGMLAYCIILRQFHIDSGYLVFVAPVLSVVAQIGDLILSAVKRKYEIKDYGKIFPGHGGILDRFDSVIAVSIFLAFVERYIGVFTVIIEEIRG